MCVERHVLGKTTGVLQTQNNVVLALHRLARVAGQALPAGMRREAGYLPAGFPAVGAVLAHFDDLTRKLMAHHGTRNQQAIVLLGGVQVIAADAAAFDRNNHLSSSG